MLIWVARSLIAALLTAALELLLLLADYPPAASGVAELVRGYLMIARVELIVVLPLGLACWGLQVVLRKATSHVRLGLRFPDPAWVLALILVVPLAGVGFAVLSRSISSKDVDFEQARLAMLSVAAVSCIGGALLAERLLTASLRPLLQHFPRLAEPARVTAIALALFALAALLVGHTVLAPANQVTRSGIVGVIAVCALLAAVTARWPSLPPLLPRIAAGVAALLLLSTPFDRHAGGRFILYGPASTAGPMASFLRGALDRDGDGTSPIWAGGTDCAEGDALRGPHVLELPGDGIDQDCSGADAPAAAASPANAAAVDLAALGCSAPSAPQTVLLITIDALRADVLRPEVMPNSVVFAQGTLHFARAYSPSTMTGPSLAGLFAGRSISELSPRNVADSDQLTVAVSLADRFRSAGYKTAAFNRIALKSTSFAGFEQYNPGIVDVQPRGKGQLLAAGMVTGASSFLQRSAGPAFVWIHFLDTHAPYVFDDGRALLPMQLPLTPYERGAQYVDSHLGRLLRDIDAMGLGTHAVIAITADHGESLGARARQGHGPYLFDDVTHVPLLIRAPNCAPRSFDDPASLTHLGATLGALAGVAVPGRGLLSSGSERKLPVVVEETPLSLVGFKRAIVSGQHKLIVDVSNGGRMLFDLAADPGETRDVYAAAPEIARALADEYQQWLDSAGNR
jgi:hypothetical protein